MGNIFAKKGTIHQPNSSPKNNFQNELITTDDIPVNARCALYSIEYYSQYKELIPIMSWFLPGRKKGPWFNFTWINAYVKCYQPKDKTTIKFIVSDFTGCCREITIPKKFIKNMILIDPDVDATWWAIKKYTPLAGYRSEKPEGINQLQIVVKSS